MKKILTIGIIGMFLLTGLGLTAVGMETTSNVKVLNDEITAVIWVRGYHPTLRMTYLPKDVESAYVELQEVDSNGDPIGEKITITENSGIYDGQAIIFEATVKEGDYQDGPFYNIYAYCENHNTGSREKHLFRADDYPLDMTLAHKGKAKTINPLFNSFFTRLLDNHPNMFPLLRAVIGL